MEWFLMEFLLLQAHLGARGQRQGRQAGDHLGAQEQQAHRG